MSSIEQLPIERFADAFDAAATQFDGLAVTDFTPKVAAPNTTPTDIDVLQQRPEPGEPGFYQVPLTRQTLGFCLGKILLRRDKNGLFMPTIVSPPTDAAFPTTVAVTRLNSPYKGNLLHGQHALTSALAQTRAAGFGGHDTRGSTAFEPGHFGTVMVGAQDPNIGEALKAQGDKAADRVLGKREGIAGEMTRVGLTEVPSATVVRDIAKEPMQLHWHHRMIDASGQPLTAAYPRAIKVLYGGAILRLGRAGLEKAKGLTPTLA